MTRILKLRLLNAKYFPSHIYVANVQIAAVSEYRTYQVYQVEDPAVKCNSTLHLMNGEHVQVFEDPETVMNQMLGL